MFSKHAQELLDSEPHVAVYYNRIWPLIHKVNLESGSDIHTGTTIVYQYCTDTINTLVIELEGHVECVWYQSIHRSDSEIRPVHATWYARHSLP